MRVNLIDMTKRKDAEQQIKRLIAGEIDEVVINNCPPEQAIFLCDNAGLSVQADNMDINGWQMDYWIPCRDVITDVEYTLTGTGYSGSVCISRDEA